MDRDRKVVSWRMLALITLLMVICFAVLWHMGGRYLAELQAESATLQADLNRLEVTYAQLQSELRRVGTDSYVENEAREKYDFIKAGEICFEFTNPDKLKDYTAEEWQVILDEKLY